MVTSSVLPWMKTSESSSLEDRAAAQDLTRARPADVCSDSNHLLGKSKWEGEGEGRGVVSSYSVMMAPLSQNGGRGTLTSLLPWH